MEKIEFGDDYLTIRERPLILKLRSLGAGIEEEEETKITYLEAAYFAYRKVLPVDQEELLKYAAKKSKSYREEYHVMKYLRDQGYIVRPSLDGTGYLRLHRKGYRPGEDKTYYLIKAVPKDWNCTIDSLLPFLETAGRLRKELVIAVAYPEKEKPLFIKFGRMNFD